MKEQLSTGNIDLRDDPNFGLEIETHSFGDYLRDMFAMPHTLKLRKINNGEDGMIQDANRIRAAFDEAISKFREEENV